MEWSSNSREQWDRGKYAKRSYGNVGTEFVGGLPPPPRIGGVPPVLGATPTRCNLVEHAV